MEMSEALALGGLITVLVGGVVLFVKVLLVSLHEEPE